MPSILPDDDLRALLEALKDGLWPNKAHQYNAVRAILEIDFLAGSSGLSATVLAIDGIVQRLKERGCSAATINRKLSFLRTLAKGAFERSFVERTPIIDRLPETAEPQRTLTSTEIDRALSALEQIDKPSHRLAAFLADTGATLAEAVALRWSDITYRYVTFWSRGQAGRAIPLTARASKALLFDPSLPRGPFTTIKLKQFRSHWYAAQIQSGLTAVIPPSALRYSCEARLVESGIALETVHKWLGYQTPRSALRLGGNTDLDDAKVILDRYC